VIVGSDLLLCIVAGCRRARNSTMQSPPQDNILERLLKKCVPFSRPPNITIQSSAIVRLEFSPGHLTAVSRISPRSGSSPNKRPCSHILWIKMSRTWWDSTSQPATKTQLATSARNHPEPTSRRSHVIQVCDEVPVYERVWTGHSMEYGRISYRIIRESREH